MGSLIRMGGETNQVQVIGRDAEDAITMVAIIMVRSDAAASARETGPLAALVKEQLARTHATAGPTLRLTPARIRLYPSMMLRSRMS